MLGQLAVPKILENWGRQPPCRIDVSNCLWHFSVSDACLSNRNKRGESASIQRELHKARRAPNSGADFGPICLFKPGKKTPKMVFMLTVDQSNLMPFMCNQHTRQSAKSIVRLFAAGECSYMKHSPLNCLEIRDIETIDHYCNIQEMLVWKEWQWPRQSGCERMLRKNVATNGLKL